MATTAEKNRAIKKALATVYGQKNVQVTGGKGTAYGWIHINVSIPPVTGSAEYRKIHNEHSSKARDVAREALKEIGESFYTYTSDDGYNSENECVLIQIHEMKA